MKMASNLSTFGLWNPLTVCLSGPIHKFCLEMYGNDS